MRTHYYSAARAAMTGGDGMFSIGPPPTRAGWNHPLMAQMADALGLTFEMIQAHWTATLLGYDPQKLLPDLRSPLQRQLDHWRRISDRDFEVIFETAYQAALANAVYAVAIDCSEIEGLMVSHGIDITIIRAGDCSTVERRYFIHEIDDLREPAKMGPPRRRSEYLRHDPTKNTRRRRRK